MLFKERHTFPLAYDHEKNTIEASHVAKTLWCLQTPFVLVKGTSPHPTQSSYLI